MENSESATAASLAALALIGNIAVLACLVDLPGPHPAWKKSLNCFQNSCKMLTSFVSWLSPCALGKWKLIWTNQNNNWHTIFYPLCQIYVFFVSFTCNLSSIFLLFPLFFPFTWHLSFCFLLCYYKMYRITRRYILSLERRYLSFFQQLYINLVYMFIKRLCISLYKK